MILFFTEIVTNDCALLLGDEHRHCSKVLRKRIGDNITMTDGKGNQYLGVIDNFTKQETKVKIVETKAITPVLCKLHMAISPTKNNARFEWFLEKATELGIQEISPIVCKRTEKPRIKKERLLKIMKSAATQSLKYHFPILHELTPFEEILASKWPMYIANYSESNSHAIHTIKKGENALIIIGPEGDFTDEELNSAKAKGASLMNLSDHRLRTETAGIAACQSFHHVNI